MGLLSLLHGKQKENEDVTTRYQHVNMFIESNTYEVTILAYFSEVDWKISEVVHLAHHRAGETLHIPWETPDWNALSTAPTSWTLGHIHKVTYFTYTFPEALSLYQMKQLIWWVYFSLSLFRVWHLWTNSSHCTLFV